MGAQSWTNTCGVCHVGGGQMEYNRDLQPYGSAGEGGGDTFVLKYARPDDPNTPEDETAWNNVEAGWMDDVNKAEMDCLMCHLDGSNPGSAWMKTLDCGPTNPIGPMTDPTCSGTPMYPGTRTVTIGDGVTDYDMFNRNFGLKQRRMDLIASMGAGAKGTFTDADSDGDVELTGIDWGTTAVSTVSAADTAKVGTMVSSADLAAMDGCEDHTYMGYMTNPATGNTYGDDGIPYRVDSVFDCVKVDAGKIAYTPKSENCAVCHARDDDTMGLPGMMAMKTGFGNYGLIHDPSNPMPSGNMAASSDLDTDNGPGAVNDDYWFDFGCKTGMGKRAHKVGATGDYIGPNGRYGMSMFLASTLDNDPATVPNAGDPVPGKMPDIDVHDASGMQCATCHYSLGSDQPDGYIDIPATTSHGFDYPAERIYAMDHQFAQADSLPDTKGKNNLDAMLQCGVCHIERTHPNLTDNGGTLDAPTPLHNGLPQLHLDRIGCVTCHVPETYSAPGRLKYRDWTAGFARGTFRNVLDWNFNLVEGNHNTVPNLRKWATKNGETKIYPFLPSLLPTWYEMVPNSGVLVADDAGMVAAGEPMDNILDEHTAFFPSPVKNRDLQLVAEAVRDSHPEFDMRLNGGNTVPLFDGFQIVDSWEIDTEAEIDAMLAEFDAQANDSDPNNADARFVSFLNVIQADFDVTHGIVPKEWALGGSERGGCVSCHSSKKQVLSVDMTSPDFMQPNPKYSPYSVGFFEGYTQPIDNKGLPNFGVGGMDIVKNWMALFADFDAAEMCGMGDPNLMAADGYQGMANANVDHHNFYFNAMTGEPNLSAACSTNSWFSNNPMFGTAGGAVAADTCGYQDMSGNQFTLTVVGADPAGNDPATGLNPACNQNATLQHVVGMMATTFDAAMGFPSGTSMQMGMYDGIAGLQGFAVRELQTAGTLGCNGFAGPISFSPMAGQSVNNCMPNYADSGVSGDAELVAQLDGMGQMMGMPSCETDPANCLQPAAMAGMINGTCVGADPAGGTPGTCNNGFRNNGACMTDADCSGAMVDVAEIKHNPMGLIMGRAEAKSHFKIDLQQSYKTDGTPKVKWGAGGDRNPSNPAHVNSWDQAAYCYDYTSGPNPMMPAVVPCNSAAAVAMDGKRHIATAQSANQYLGYSESTLAMLMNPAVAVANQEYVVDASFSALASADYDLTVTFDASRASCYQRDPETSVVTEMACDYSWDIPGGTVIGGTADHNVVVEFPAAGVYAATLTMTMVDDPATPGDESAISDTQSLEVEAIIVEPPVADMDFATAVSGNTVTLTAPLLDANVVRAYIYWGDRKRTVSVDPQADLAAGIDYTYARGGRDYNIRVLVIDSDHVKTNYTFDDDGDLTVTIP